MASAAGLESGEPRRWRRLRTLATWALVTAAACDPGGGAPVRGFGSRQLVAIRDSSLHIAGQLSDNVAVYSTVDPSSGGASYWKAGLNDGDGRPHALAAPRGGPAPAAQQ